MDQLNIGIIGDYDANLISHPVTNTAIEHAADRLAVKANVEWIPTPSLLTTVGLEKLERFDGLWASSGSPYRSMEGALSGIRFAREQNKPFFGT
ncbi:hypothetical protein ACFLVW_07705 [Chloroflexota bacterium]